MLSPHLSTDVEHLMGQTPGPGDLASPSLATPGKSLSFSRPLLASAKCQLQTLGSVWPCEGQAGSGPSPVQAPADRAAGDRSLSLTLQNRHGDKNWYMGNIYCGAGKTHPFLGAACLLDPRVSSSPSAGGLSSQTLSFTAVTAVCNYTRT